MKKVTSVIPGWNPWTSHGRHTVYEKLRKYGFTYVSLDILGYRTGSMNETLDKADME